MCKHLVRVKELEEQVHHLRLALYDYRATIDELLLRRLEADAVPVDLAQAKVAQMVFRARVAQ